VCCLEKGEVEVTTCSERGDSDGGSTPASYVVAQGVQIGEWAPSLAKSGLRPHAKAGEDCATTLTAAEGYTLTASADLFFLETAGGFDYHPAATGMCGCINVFCVMWV